MRAATSTMTARLLAEWMSFVGWLHTAVRKDSRALALFADAEDLADEAADGTIAATAASFRGYLARLQGRPSGAIRASAAALATREPTPHTRLTTCCKPRRHTCGPAGRRVDERISPSTRLCQRACLTRKEPSLLSSRDGLSLLPLHAAPT
jgi:hypothetical protein